MVILGGSHVSKSRNPNRDPNTTTLVEQRYPGSVYVVLLAASTHRTASKWRVPSLVPILEPPDQSDFGDALLYLGENLTPADPDWQHYRVDPIYMKELDRRAHIEWGCGFDLKRFINGRLPCP